MNINEELQLPMIGDNSPDDVKLLKSQEIESDSDDEEHQLMTDDEYLEYKMHKDEQIEDEDGAFGSDKELHEQWKCCEDEIAIIENTLFVLGQRYTFIQRIHGRESHAVYKAMDKTKGIYVAIKICVKKSQKKNLPIELRILSQVKNIDGCQQLLAYHVFPFSYVLVSKLEVEDNIRKCVVGKMAVIQSYMQQLLTILSRLHERNIIYRDVKKSNVLWRDETSKLILIDFDLSTYVRLDDVKRGHRVVLGTTGYLAPEVSVFEDEEKTKAFRRGCLGYNTKVDIYSAGILFGCLLFGVPEDDLQENQSKRWKKKLKRLNSSKLDGFTRAAYTMMKRMLQHKPDQRPSAHELLNDEFFMHGTSQK